MPVPQFQYAPFVNPYAPTIGDEIARSGDAFARAAEIVGQANANATAAKSSAWAHAIESSGTIPFTVAATQNQNAERKLKEQELSLSVEQRAEAQRQRYVMTVGRIAGVSTSPAQFSKHLDDAVAGGALPADTAAHVKQQLASGADDPEAFRQTRQQYVEFADQYMQPMTVKPGETIGRPSVGGGFNPIVSQPEVKEVGPGATLATVTPGAGGQPTTATPLLTAPKTEVVNGQPMRITADSATPIGPPVPKQETASETAERQAQTLKLTREAQEIDQKLAGTAPLSPKDKAELELRRAQIALETARNNRMERKEDVSDPRYQGQLEKQYRDLAAKVISSRNGVLGIEDAKVTQAKHLIGMMEQFKDKDGSYQIPVAQQMELAMGLAALIAPRGVPTERQVEELKQRTAKGDIAGLLTYVTGNAVSGSTQGIAKMLRDSIERQGHIAEGNREKELDAIRSFRPTDLDETRATGIEQGLGGLNRMADVGVTGGAPKDGQEGSVNGVAAVWRQRGPQGPGWYRK